MSSCRPRRLPQRLAAALFLACLPLLACALGSARAGKPGAGTSQEPQVATDPAFRELAGGLLEGIPEFPAYPGATLVGSAERNRPTEPNRGYRIMWTTTDTPGQVIAWYARMLPPRGWAYGPPDEPEDEEELKAKIAKGALRGYLEAEVEDGITEIIVVLARRHP